MYRWALNKPTSTAHFSLYEGAERRFARTFAFLFALAAGGFSLYGCGGASAHRTRLDAQITLAHADKRVGTYVSSAWGFETNSYWIEGPDGLIVIDTQFLLSAAEEVVDLAERATGKKVVMAIVLHANPDKFNGTAVMKRRGIRVVTSAQVRALIPGVHEKRLKAFYDRYKPDYPSAVSLPDSFGDKTTELSAGGVTVRAHVLGGGCSEAHVVVEWEGHVFAGDLVASGVHSWLELGLVDEWIARVGEMRAMKPTSVHPGRGPSGGAGLLDQQAAYLHAVDAAIASEMTNAGSTASDAAISRARDKVTERYPGFDYDVFLNFGLPAVWERKAKRASRP
jgi:glyoxylase-like metal-dependent hydrolase (beta-lactamase superfamily II)